MRTKKKYYMPQWALKKIEALANFYETTKTQALLMMIDKGSNYYEKAMRKAGMKIEDNTTSNPAETLSGFQSDENIISQSQEEIEKILKADWIHENN